MWREILTLANGWELPVLGPQAQVSGRGPLHHAHFDLPL